MALNPGTKLGPYEIISQLGAGGMGEVYRARDSGLGRDVAIKVLPSLLSRDPDRLRRFEQEARATAALNHPNILAIFQMGNYEGAPYLVSELLEGNNLRDLFTRGPLPVRKAIDYGVQVAHGLAAAHEKGIVHRDLKPENLFVTRDGKVKILDFGLAKLTHTPRDSELNQATKTANTEPGVVMGTASYMSPEQVRGDLADHRTDIFALGAILHEMLSGKRAFQKPTPAETMSAILNEDPVALSQIAVGIPPALERVVHRCLEKNPEQRFQSASDLAFALDALSDSGSSATSVVRRAPSRISWKSAMAGLVIAAIVGLAVRWALPPPVPQVTAVNQLTDDGQPKHGRLVSDGTRIYFNEGQTGSWRVFQVSAIGGQTAPIPTRLQNPKIAALASDSSALLAADGGFVGPLYPLWLIPLPAGDPRRIGELEVQDATFLPDRQIAFIRGNGLFIVGENGGNPRKVADLPTEAFAPSVSPDGERLNITVCCDRPALRELALRNSRFRELVKAEPDSVVCCGSWTPNGKYLLFQALRNERWDLWARREQAGLFQRDLPPVRLTNGPLSYTDAVASRDGKQIFAIGSKARGELVRYDQKTKQYVPFLSGISATDPTFSSDGQWVTYRAYPDYTLWRSRTDGSDRLQLTYPPQVVWLPFISPDGTKVSFGDGQENLFVVSLNGGTPRKVAEHCGAGAWSPDNNFLAITCSILRKEESEKNNMNIKIIDLQTGRISPVPESEGKFGPFWMDQHTLVAAKEDATEFLTFDLNTNKWSELLSGTFVNWFISPDRTYLLYTTGGAEPQAQRIRFSDHRMEPIVSLKDLRRVVDVYFGVTQINIAPDGSPLFTRDIGTQEIYALDVKWP